MAERTGRLRRRKNNSRAGDKSEERDALIRGRGGSAGPSPRPCPAARPPPEHAGPPPRQRGREGRGKVGAANFTRPPAGSAPAAAAARRELSPGPPDLQEPRPRRDQTPRGGHITGERAAGRQPGRGGGGGRRMRGSRGLASRSGGMHEPQERPPARPPAPRKTRPRSRRPGRPSSEEGGGESVDQQSRKEAPAGGTPGRRRPPPPPPLLFAQPQGKRGQKRRGRRSRRRR